jgi:hypothetical protein
MDDKPLPQRRPWKTFTISNPASFGLDNLEIRLDDRPHLWSTTRNVFMKEPCIEIEPATASSASSSLHPASRALVASAKLIPKSHGCRIRLGGDDASKSEKPAAQWELVACANPEQGIYMFNISGSAVLWRRLPPITNGDEDAEAGPHDADFHGAHAASYELIDARSSTVLARYTSSSSSSAPLDNNNTNEIPTKDQIAQLDFLLEVGPAAELLALASILAIQLRLRRNRRKKRNLSMSSVGGGGGGRNRRKDSNLSVSSASLGENNRGEGAASNSEMED